VIIGPKLDKRESVLLTVIVMINWTNVCTYNNAMDYGHRIVVKVHTTAVVHDCVNRCQGVQMYLFGNCSVLMTF